MTGKRAWVPDLLLDLFTHPLDPGYADAAARRATAPPARGWRRGGPVLLRCVALVAIGFLLTVAYRQAASAAPEQAGARAGLVDEVRAAQARTDDLQRRRDDLQRDVARQREAALGAGSGELAALRRQEAATGLAAVTGDGVVVRLGDATPQIDPTTGRPSLAEVSRVLDVDLQAVVNGLWLAGAEAVAINGQRLTATSTIRAAGGAILVDFRPVTSPYEISAIGPDELADAFAGSSAAAGARDLVQRYGLSFGSEVAEGLRLPAAPGRGLRYADPSPTPTTPAPTSGGPR